MVPRAQLDPTIDWIDVLGVAMLAGIGFTVSLLIGDLAFRDGSHGEEFVTIGVVAGSVLSALLAAVVLRARNRHYRQIAEQESVDADDDGIPDVFQS